MEILFLETGRPLRPPKGSSHAACITYRSGNTGKVSFHEDSTPFGKTRIPYTTYNFRMFARLGTMRTDATTDSEQWLGWVK